MTEANNLTAWKAMGQALACGRTTAEQIESIRRYGNHGASPVLRAGLLAALGVEKPKDRAEYCLIFGCYRPFTTPFLVRDFVRLLNLLNVDYTYLEQEHCCGFPFFLTASAGELGDAKSTSGEFNRLNSDLARQKGASKLIYCCAGCVHAARETLPDETDRHGYMIDLMLDCLENKQLEALPTVIGYFEGCHTFTSKNFPGVKLDWDRYRRRLGEIKGLEIVNIAGGMCCKNSAEKIVDAGLKMNVQKILAPCSGCYGALSKASQGKAPVIGFAELFMQSLEHTAKLAGK